VTTAKSQFKKAPAADVAHDTPKSFDVFLIHTAAEAPAAAWFAGELRRRGVEPWLAHEQGLRSNRWKHDALDRLNRLPACALLIGPAGLPGKWGRREVDEAAHRKSMDPAFRFLLVYLPDAEPAPPEALPLAPDAVVALEADDDAEGLDQIVALLREAASSEAETVPLSPSVKAATRLSGPVTSFQIVRRLLESHPEYAGGRIKPSDLVEGSDAAPQRPVEEWLAAVRALYEPARAQVLHGRLMIDGLARLDRQLLDCLTGLGVLDKVRGDTTPAPDTLLRRKRDAVETLADQPANVDELGREVIAKILASRMRRVRLRELERNKNDADKTRRRGGPFLLHVYGRWGAGKTSLLYFLRRQLEADVWDTGAAATRRTYASAVREALRRRRTGADARADDLGGDPLQRWIVIEFNGWQHQRIVPPWWWLMDAVTTEGSRQLKEIDRPRWARLKLWDYKWRLRGAVPGVLMVATGVVIGWLVWKSGKVHTGNGFSASLLAAVEGVAKSIAVIVALLVTLWGGAKSLSRWLLVGSPRGASQVLRHGSDPLESLSARFHELVTRLSYPVAIFIDDLDRCKATYVVELLEGIQTLFKAVPVTYVVAADREWICQSFALQYEGFCSAVGEPGRPLGHLFLEKTFQLSAPVPSLSDDTRSTYLEQLLRPSTENGEVDLEHARREAHKRFQTLTSREDIDAELEHASGSAVEHQAAAEAAVLRLTEPELEEQTEHMLQPFAPLLEPNPRSMKRLVNAYGISSAVEILRRTATSGMNGSTPISPEELALWTILDLRWPLLGDYVTRRPDAIDEIMRGATPPADGSDWLKSLWDDDDVKDVLGGNAPHVNASLSSATVAKLLGRRETITH
jgi:hypothetical protein